MFPPQCSCCSASSVFCSIALRLLFCSPLSAGCSASPLCFLLFPPQVLDPVSRSSRKDSAETLLCLAERASLLRVCTVLMLCETTGRGLEICVTVSDLVLPHLCVCVCMSCLWNLSVFAVILRTCPRVSVLFCLFVSFVGLYAIVSRPDSAEGFSSCPSTGSRNGEKDWENESTTSSTPSNAEYTGTICACDVYTPPRPLYVTWYPFFFFLRSHALFLSHRTQTVQGAECQVQQAHHPERPGSLLPGWQGQRRAEEQDTGCMFWFDYTR